MQLTRSTVLPISSQRGIHIWEFQALADDTQYTIVALDVRERSIVDWKHLTTDFEHAVAEYQQRIAARRAASFAESPPNATAEPSPEACHVNG